MEFVSRWINRAGELGFVGVVDAVTPVWWVITGLVLFGAGFFSTGRVGFGSTLSVGCLAAGIADALGASATVQLIVVPLSSLLLLSVFTIRMLRRRDELPATVSVVPGGVEGLVATVVSVDPERPWQVRVRVKDRHPWSAACTEGHSLVVGDKVRVLARDGQQLEVQKDPGLRRR